MNKSLIWMYANLLDIDARILKWYESNWKACNTLGWKNDEWKEVHMIHQMMMNTIRAK